MAAIGDGWADGSWIFASWVSGAWASGVAAVVVSKKFVQIVYAKRRRR